MTREKAAPECAGPDCTRDAIMAESPGGKTRWCVSCCPRPEPEPCDAVLKRDDDGKPTLVCGATMGTSAVVMHWADGKRHVRCQNHNTREWLMREFTGRKIGG